MTKVITMSGSTYEIFKKDSKIFLKRISNHCANSKLVGIVKDTETVTLELKGMPTIGLGEQMICRLADSTPYGDMLRTSPVKEVFRS